MTKFAALCAKPITYGAYFKVCGISFGVMIVEFLVGYALVKSGKCII